MEKERVVQVSREVEATPEAVFRALTHPLDLTYWFCHSAWTEPREGGNLLVRWRNGWWAQGVYQAIEKPWRVVSTWKGKDEPGETELTFKVEPLDHGTEIEITHSGFGADALWDKALAEAEKSWPRALENLESVLTTGIDLRVATRPLVGILPAELTPERAAKEEIATETGVYVAGVIEEGGAAEAGLQKGDVITSMDGLAITDLGSLTTTLSPFEAGDVVEVHYVRGRDRGSVQVELKPRPMPEISFDPQQMVEQVRQETTSLLAALRETVVGLSEEEAEQKTADEEWSVKETLAHLSLNERFTHKAFTDIILGTTSSQSGGNPTTVPEMLTMTLEAAPTVEDLLARFEQDTTETLSIFAALRPDVVAIKARYRHMANILSFWPIHTRDHLNQIKTIIEAVRS